MSDIYKLHNNGMTLAYPGWNGYVGYIKEEPHYEYTTLWETNTPFNNMYSITLNDSINNYDDLIVYGSANRDNVYFINCENNYVVDKNGINFCNSFYNGIWSTAADAHILCNGTQLLLSCTSGRVTSSYYMDQNAGVTTWCGWKSTAARVQDIHPYKIVGAKYVE